MIVSAGTADQRVAREARITCRYLGQEPEMITDAGVAGVHRLLDRGISVMFKCPVFRQNAGAEYVMPAFAKAFGAALDMGAQIRAGNSGSNELLSLNANLDQKANVYERTQPVGV